MKKIINKTIVAILLLLTCSCVAYAESLEEFERTLVQYQRNPMQRVAELKAIGYDTVSKEDIISHQLQVPYEILLAFESTVAKRMNYYLSIYYFEKQDTTADTTIIDQDTLNELVQQTPPYTLLYYTELIDNVEKCGVVIAQREEYIKSYKEGLIKCTQKKAELESEYRVCNNKIETGTKDLLKENWNLEFIKGQLELCIIQERFYNVAMASRQNSINDVKAKQAILEKLLEKVRYKVTFSKDDYRYLDHWVQENISDLLGTAEKLNTRYDELTDIRKNGERPTAFTKFCYATEQTLIENEVLVLLNIAEDWTSLRAFWRLLEPLTTDRMNKNFSHEQLHEQIESFISNAERDEKYCISELSKIDAAEVSANALFGKDSIILTSADIKVRDEFFVRIAEHKRRMNRYLLDVIAMKNRCQDIANEVNTVLGNKKEDSKQKFQNLVRLLTSLRDFELVHFEEYPVTLGSLLMAIFILIICNFIALCINYFIRRRMRKRRFADKHTVLLVTTAIKYTTWLIAILISLSSLRIPFKAFAFMGGALAVALGFGAQNLMSDMFCGISLLVKNRIRVGDHITLNGHYGIVKEITLRDTVIIAEDSKDVVIPNRKFFSEEFVNLTLTNTIVRTGIGVGISYGSDVLHAEKIILDILDHSIYVVKEPYRRVLFNKFDDSSLGLVIQFFMDLAKYSQFEVQSKVREEILEAFRKNNIEIAYPQLDVHFDKITPNIKGEEL